MKKSAPMKLQLLFTVYFFHAVIGLAEEPKPVEEIRSEVPPLIADEPYEGFRADRALLRKTFVQNGHTDHPIRASHKDAKAAAVRIFRRVSFLLRTRDEVLDLLGPPETISGYNKPAGKEPGDPLTYRFDNGWNGFTFTLTFKKRGQCTGVSITY